MEEFRESSLIELKLEVSVDFKKEVIAFANSEGGTIYVGVSDSGEVVGVSNANRQEETIGNMIRDGIRPDLTPYTQISILQHEGKELICVRVQSGVKKPYHLTDKGLKSSGVFLRHGTSSVPASLETIRQMIRDTDGTVYEQMRSLNQELTFFYAEEAFAKRKLPFGESQQRTLGLFDSDGYYTNAALLLSDQCGHIIRCGVYDGITKETFRTRREFGGSILKQVDDAYAFLMLNNPLQATFSGLHRIDSYAYPDQALREALLNAVIHRDYDYTGSILINVYDNRMEFVSIGGLVKGLTMEDIMAGVSQPRNPVIANIFYRLNLIESYGTGIDRMLTNYQDCGAKPQFKDAPASFVVTLPNRNQVVQPSSNRQLSDVDNLRHLIKERGEVSRKDVELFLNCSSYTANTLLKNLLSTGEIEKRGAARSTRYYHRG